MFMVTKGMNKFNRSCRCKNAILKTIIVHFVQTNIKILFTMKKCYTSKNLIYNSLHLYKMRQIN